MVVGGRELIDTLWNVNTRLRLSLRLLRLELIDTLWNVNNRTISLLLLRTRINRYIMECKY